MTYTPPVPPYFGPVLKFTKGSNFPIVRIVVHYTAGSDATGAQGTARYFRTDPNAGGSAHYITDSDETIQCAYDSVICWHAPPNPHSLGIEMECSGVSKAKGHWTLANHVAMMHRTAKLTAQKCLQYGVPARKLTVAQVRAGERGICGHWDVSLAFGQSTHDDPGPYFPWVTFMVMVRVEYNALIAPPPEEMGTLAAADADRVIQVIRDIEATAGPEGQRYADIITRLQGLINVETGRYADYVARFAKVEAAVQENGIAETQAIEALTAAVQAGAADQARAITLLTDAVTALTAALPKG